MFLLLGKMDLKTLAKELTNVEGTRWFQLGIHVGVREHSLKNIEANFKGDVERCKQEMLTVWMQTDFESSWGTLADALEKIGMNTDAQRLRQKYNVSPKSELPCIYNTKYTIWPINNYIINGRKASLACK